MTARVIEMRYVSYTATYKESSSGDRFVNRASSDKHEAIASLNLERGQSHRLLRLPELLSFIAGSLARDGSSTTAEMTLHDLAQRSNTANFCLRAPTTVSI